MGWGGARPGSGPKARRKPKLHLVATPGPNPGIAAEPTDKPKSKRIKIPHEAMARSRQRSPKVDADRQATRVHPFILANHPPSVFPRGRKPTLAQDEAITTSLAWAANIVLTGAFEAGIGFMGYAYLSELAQRAEYRVISETLATEATRKWIRIQSAQAVNAATAKKRDETGDPSAEPDAKEVEAQTDDGKTEIIRAIEKEFERLRVRDVFRTCSEQDGFFGRSHIYIDIGDARDEREELLTPIGDGSASNRMSRAKIRRGSLERIANVEPVWCYPARYNSNDPLSPGWYNPESWFVMGKEMHSTRLLTFVGREVPDLLKPAYSFGGLAMSQMAKPTVDNWLRTRQSVSDLIHAFSIMVLHTDMSESLGISGTELFERMDFFNNVRDNRGLMAVDKDTEDLTNVTVPLGTLDALQAQAQEHMASVTRTPVVKLLGIQPAGLNASSEGEIDTWDDWVAAYQQKFMREKLTRILGFAQLNLFGKVDPDISFEFEPLRQMTEKERGEIDKAEAEADQIRIDTGVIHPEEARRALAAKEDSRYSGIDPADVPEPPQEEDGGGDPFGGGGDDPEGGTPPKKEAGAQDAVLLPFAGGADDTLASDDFKEADHPRGQPGNAGQFGSGGGGSSKKEKQTLKMPQYGLTPTPHAAYHGYKAQNPTPMPKSEGKATEAGSTVVFEPGKAGGPKTLNGVAFESWQAPEDLGDWADVEGQAEINEPEMPELPDGMTLSSGVIITEPDGRVWLLRPKGGYGGYHQTFPKGGVEKGLSMQANAIKEAYEETGLKVRITGFAGDHEGDVTVTRFYTAEREGGNPADAGRESEGVILVPPEKLKTLLNRKRDLEIAAGLQPPLDPDKMKKVGKQMGSNPGGVYEDDSGQKFYIKKGKSPDHVKNELIAGALYNLAGAPTLKYRAVKGGGHIATEMVPLDKSNANEFDAEDIADAQQDFATHAWLANWDAVGLGGDNLGIVNGIATSLDLGGAMAYRAQGAPKGSAFGNKVGELDTLRSAKMNPDSAGVFGKMSDKALKESVERVTSIPDAKIIATVKAGGGDPALADKLIARKRDMAARYKLSAADSLREILLALDDAGHFEEGKHPRDAGGKFAETAGGGGGAGSNPDPSQFSSKKDHVAHLLLHGTTTKEILAATGWPSVSVPAMAKAAGLKLQKTKLNGETIYKAMAMTAEEKAAAAAELKAKATAAKTTPTVVAAAEISGKPVAEVAKVAAAMPPPPPAKFPPATPAELEKAKKNVKLQLQYVPGAPQNSAAAQKLVDAFNQKYEGKVMASPAALQQKVQDFKQLAAAMIPLQSAEQQAVAKAAQATAAKQAEAAAAAKKKEAETLAKSKAELKQVMTELGLDNEVDATAVQGLMSMMGTKDPADFLKKFKGLSTAGAAQHGVTAFEMAMLQAYTGSAYGAVNKSLRQGSWSLKQHMYVNAVNKALKKLPSYTGVTKRGTDLDSSVQALYVEGNVVEERAFTSTSKNQGWGGNTSYVISGKSGRDVQSFSHHHSEAEVLYPARTFFRVEKVEGKPGGHMTVHMKEVEAW